MDSHKALARSNTCGYFLYMAEIPQAPDQQREYANSGLDFLLVKKETEEDGIWMFENRCVEVKSKKVVFLRQ